MKKSTTNDPMRFSFWESFSRGIAEMDGYEEIGLTPEEVEFTKMRFTYDIAQYGAWLIEPDWDAYDIRVRTAVRFAWELLLPNIKSSQKAATTGSSGGKQGGRGNKRGRPRKKKVEEPAEVPETPIDYSSDERGWDSVCISRELA